MRWLSLRRGLQRWSIFQHCSLALRRSDSWSAPKYLWGGRRKQDHFHQTLRVYSTSWYRSPTDMRYPSVLACRNCIDSRTLKHRGVRAQGVLYSHPRAASSQSSGSTSGQSFPTIRSTDSWYHFNRAEGVASGSALGTIVYFNTKVLFLARVSRFEGRLGIEFYCLSCPTSA